MTNKRSSVSVKRQKQQKLVQLFLVFLFVVLGCIGLLILPHKDRSLVKRVFKKQHLQNTVVPQDDPWDWSTYTDTKIGFSIDYPPYDEVRIEDDSDWSIIIHSTERSRYVGVPEHRLTLSVHELESSMSMEQLITKKYNIVGHFIEPEHIPFDIFSDLRFRILLFSRIPNVAFEGMRFIAIEVEGEEDLMEGGKLNEAYIKIPHQNKYLYMRDSQYGGGMVILDEEKTLFDEILATIRFK